VRLLVACLIIPAAAIAQEPAASLASGAAAAGLEAPIRGLTLDDAIKLALENNYDLIRQRLLSLSSEQDRILAQAAIMPRVDFNAGVGRTRSGAGTVVFQGSRQNIPLTFNNSFIAGASLRQLVFDGGKWWNNISGAELGLKASRVSVDEQRLQTIYLVEQRFYELVRAQRQLRVLADAAARSRDQAGNVQRLFEGGRSTQADVYQARANRDNDEIVRLGQERTVELARADLALAIGVDPSEPVNIAEPPRLFDDPAQPPGAREAVERALANRPSLKAFELQAESQRKFARAARGDYWPTISLEGSYNRNARDLPTFDDPNLGLSSQLSGTVNLNWNLFAGFATNANVRKAEVQVRLSENDLQNGRRNVAADVEKAIAQLATARTQVHVAGQAVETAKEGLRLAKTRQIVGVGTELEVRDAELKLTQSELAHVGALVDGREAEAALRRAQGG
jgi:outer membrane protein